MGGSGRVMHSNSWNHHGNPHDPRLAAAAGHPTAYIAAAAPSLHGYPAGAHPAGPLPGSQGFLLYGFPPAPSRFPSSAGPTRGPHGPPPSELMAQPVAPNSVFRGPSNGPSPPHVPPTSVSTCHPLQTSSVASCSGPSRSSPPSVSGVSHPVTNTSYSSHQLHSEFKSSYINYVRKCMFVSIMLLFIYCHFDANFMKL